MDEIKNKINEKCDELSLMVDRAHLPIKVGPDCYLFHATPKDDNCSKRGVCHQERYYALTGGKIGITIVKDGEVVT